MVIYEAARALVNLKNVESRDLCPAISGMNVIFVSVTNAAEFPAVVDKAVCLRIEKSATVTHW